MVAIVLLCTYGDDSRQDANNDASAALYARMPAEFRNSHAGCRTELHQNAELKYSPELEFVELLGMELNSIEFQYEKDSLVLPPAQPG